MDADAYERVSSALQKDGKTIQLPVFPHPVGIDKIVWSVWDYILGPELMFTWEVTAGEPPPSSDSQSETDANNLDATFESTGDGLEYDSDFQGKILRTPADIHPCGVCSDPDCSGTCDFDPIPGFGSPDLGNRTFNGSIDRPSKAGLNGNLQESQTSTITSSTAEDEDEQDSEENEQSGPLSSLTFSLSNQPTFPSDQPSTSTRDRRSSERESIERKKPSHGDRSISETSSITVLTEGASGFTSVSGSRANSDSGSGATGLESRKPLPEMDKSEGVE